MFGKLLQFLWKMVRGKDIMQSLVEERNDSLLLHLFTRRSQAAERVIDGMINLLDGEGICAEMPWVRITRSWVHAGKRLGMHRDGLIILNGVRAVQSGHCELRLTIGHEIGHYVDTPDCRRELGLSRHMHMEVYAETVAHFLEQRRRYPPVISRRQRSNIIKRAAKIAMAWKRLIS